MSDEPLNPPSEQPDDFNTIENELSGFAAEEEVSEVSSPIGIEEPAIPAADGALISALNTIHSIRKEIRKVITGQGKVIDQVLIALLSSGHALIEGVPGLGKTLLVKALAKTINSKFGRIQFTPDLMPADVMGHAVFDSKTQTFKIRKGPIFTNLLLADEINRAPAKTQSSLLEVMQEQQVTIEGYSYPVTAPFLVLATQNPIEQEGTYPLPEAQLDRFLLKITIDYPTEDEEIALVEQVTSKAVTKQLSVDHLDTVVTSDGIKKLQDAVLKVTVDKQVNDYAVRLVRATRSHVGISVGAGPRGCLALIIAARSSALLNSRTYVIPDDIKEMALPVLRHRIALTPEMEIEGRSRDDLIKDILSNTQAPRL